MKQLLTGKCKEDFDKWLQGTHYNNRHDTWIHWLSTTLSMQYGVIQDFADSVKIPFFVKHVENYIYEVTYDFWVYGYGWGENFKTRSQAQEEAIKQFNNIYNETT